LLIFLSNEVFQSKQVWFYYEFNETLRLRLRSTYA